MQELFAKLFWENEEILEQAARLRETMPGFFEVQQAYDALSEQLREAAGRDLYDKYFTQLIRYTNYEVQAYYSLGLGLREDITKALGA